MTVRSDEVIPLLAHIRHVRHAIATTTCQMTTSMPGELLAQAEADLPNIHKFPNSIHTKVSR